MAVQDFDKTLAAQIAQELGSEWSAVERPHNNVVLRRNDGLEISTNVNWRDNSRLEFSQNYHNPDWVDSDGERVDPTSYNTSLPSITAAAKKSAKQLARDILRRLVPDCEPFHAEATKRVRGRNASEDARQVAARELGIEGYKSQYRSNARTEYTRRWELDEQDEHAPYRKVEAKVCGPYRDGDSAMVDLELGSLSVEQAKAVLAALGLSV